MPIELQAYIERFSDKANLPLHIQKQISEARLEKGKIPVVLPLQLFKQHPLYEHYISEPAYRLAHHYIPLPSEQKYKQIIKKQISYNKLLNKLDLSTHIVYPVIPDNQWILWSNLNCLLEESVDLTDILLDSHIEWSIRTLYISDKVKRSTPLFRAHTLTPFSKLDFEDCPICDLLLTAYNPTKFPKALRLATLKHQLH